jgi:hypothetical protein
LKTKYSFTEEDSQLQSAPKLLSILQELASNYEVDKDIRDAGQSSVDPRYRLPLQIYGSLKTRSLRNTLIELVMLKPMHEHDGALSPTINMLSINPTSEEGQLILEIASKEWSQSKNRVSVSFPSWSTAHDSLLEIQERGLRRSRRTYAW